MPRLGRTQRHSSQGQIRAGVAVVLVGLALATLPTPRAGCARSLGGQSVPAPRPREPAKATIRFLAMEYDSQTRPYMERLERDFEAAHPEIDVSIEVVGWHEGWDEISSRIDRGETPDLMNITNLWLAELADGGVLEALDDCVTQEFRDRFLRTALRGAEYGGRLYGLPIAMSARALYCNAGLLRAAGERPPSTWDDLVRVAGKVGDPTEGISGIGIQGGRLETDIYFYYFLWGNGGEILSADGRQARFSSPEGVEALQFMCDLVHKYQVAEPNPIAYDREGLQDLFRAGRLAMTITGPWFSRWLHDYTPELEYLVAPIPGRKTHTTAVMVDLIVMAGKSRNKRAAWEFVEFFYQPERRREWAETFGMLPELNSVAESEYVTSNPERAVFVELARGGKTLPLHRRWQDVADEVAAAVREALDGERSPADALNSAAGRVNAILAGD